MHVFAVIMPLYNKAPYVARAVQSVLAQTCEDWELWVVDDGSTDGSDKEVMRFTDPRIHLHQQANAGVSAARNKGVALSGEATFRSPKASSAGAPYLCFLDADDWWEPTFLEEMAALISRHPDAGIYGTGYYIVKNNRKRVAPIGVNNDFTEGEINYFQVYARTLCMPLWTGAVCIPRSIYNELDGFDEQLSMSEDFDLWYRIAMQHKVVLLNNPLSNYNQDVNPHTRAMGSLPPPERQFAFQNTKVPSNSMAQQVIDMVRIVCLRQYYLSSQYHQQAADALSTIDMHPHRGKSYAKYLEEPLWILRIKKLIYHIASRLR